MGKVGCHIAVVTGKGCEPWPGVVRKPIFQQLSPIHVMPVVSEFNEATSLQPEVPKSSAGRVNPTAEASYYWFCQE
jgi:hypothetical protein